MWFDTSVVERPVGNPGKVCNLNLPNFPLKKKQAFLEGNWVPLKVKNVLGYIEDVGWLCDEGVISIPAVCCVLFKHLQRNINMHCFLYTKTLSLLRFLF